MLIGWFMILLVSLLGLLSLSDLEKPQSLINKGFAAFVLAKCLQII